LGRGDDVPNQALAKKLAAHQDKEDIQELVDNPPNDDSAIQSDCIKTLYEVGYLDPALIAGHWEAFLALLASKNNRMVWGGMIALATIAKLRAEELFPHVNLLQQAIENGSVITQDHGIKTLAALAAQREVYREALLPDLFSVLKSCRPKDVLKNAEVILTALNREHREEFVNILTSRLPELTQNQQNRLKRTLEKALQA
jgi:hypothetical protein